MGDLFWMTGSKLWYLGPIWIMSSTPLFFCDDAIHKPSPLNAPHYKLSICLVEVMETKLWEPTLQTRVSVKKDM